MTRPMLVAGIVGLVVGVVVVGVVWLASGSSSGVTVGNRAIRLPESVGEFVPFAEVQLNQSGPGAENAPRIASWDNQSALRLSKATSGAASIVQSYADNDLRNQLSVLAYRAQSSPNPPFVPYQDANTLGLARPPEEMDQFSNVSCVLRNDPTQVGSAANTNTVHTTFCVRTGPQLTVEIRPTGDISNEPQRVAQL